MKTLSLDGVIVTAHSHDDPALSWRFRSPRVEIDTPRNLQIEDLLLQGAAFDVMLNGMFIVSARYELHSLIRIQVSQGSVLQIVPFDTVSIFARQYLTSPIVVNGLATTFSNPTGGSDMPECPGFRFSASATPTAQINNVNSGAFVGLMASLGLAAGFGASLLDSATPVGRSQMADVGLSFVPGSAYQLDSVAIAPSAFAAGFPVALSTGMTLGPRLYQAFVTGQARLAAATQARKPGFVGFAIIDSTIPVASKADLAAAGVLACWLVNPYPLSDPAFQANAAASTVAQALNLSLSLANFIGPSTRAGGGAYQVFAFSGMGGSADATALTQTFLTTSGQITLGAQRNSSQLSSRSM